MQGKMKKRPGPDAPPFLRRPSLKITALSYSCKRKNGLITLDLFAKKKPRDSSFFLAFHDFSSHNFHDGLELTLKS